MCGVFNHYLGKTKENLTHLPSQPRNPQPHIYPHALSWLVLSLVHPHVQALILGRQLELTVSF